MSPLELSELQPEDHAAALALWNSSPGVRANETREEFERILRRNPGLSPTVRMDGKLVGAVLCCHDGRRGYLYHLAVAESHRRRGIGKQLVNACLQRLAAEGISRCTIFLVANNEHGREFWQRSGWFERTDLVAFAHDLKTT